MKEYFVYCIYNKTHQKIYIGQTESLQRRLTDHNNKLFQGYTSRFNGKWTLIHSEKLSSRTQALSREKQLKSYRGREFCRSLIQN